jgi:putative peptide zinc metalloprotease protein
MSTTHLMSEEKVALVPHLERCEGLDGQVLLYDRCTGRYVRVAAASEWLIGQLASPVTLSGLVARAARAYRVPLDEARPAVEAFVAELRQAGMLDRPAVRENGRQRIITLVRSVPTLHLVRILLPSSLTQLSHRRIEGRGLALLGAVMLASGAAASVACLTMVEVGSPHGRVAWLALLPAIVLAILAHELAHIAVDWLLGIPVRAVGIALWYYMIPIAYVDHTDGYRLRARSQKVAVALAGPWLDLTAAGLAAILALSVPSCAPTARAIAFTLLAGFVFNLNPLLPTDGYRALEAAVGELAFRSRALTFASSRLLRVPLPASLRSASRPWRVLYAAYVAASIAYVGVIVTAGTLGIERLITKA